MTKHSKTTGVKATTTDEGVIEAPALGELPAANENPTEAESAATTSAPGPRKPRENTKQATVIDMLRGDAGATIPEFMQATGWLSHTVRGFLAGALKKRGLIVTSEVVENRGRVYHLPQA